MKVDFGKTAEDYARWRVGFPDALWDRLRRFGVGEQGQEILDIGTGTGTLARGFARRGCRVTGLDPAGELLEEAKRLDREAGVQVRYVNARAEATGLPDDAYDGVSAGQCWHWTDRRRAAREVIRVTRPGGFFVMTHFNWIPLPGNVAAATEDLIREYNPDWNLGGRTGIFPEWPRDAGIAGFEDIEIFTFDVSVVYNHEAWRGRIRASAGVAASLAADRVEKFDRKLKEMLADRFPETPLEIPHRVYTVVCRAPGRRKK